MKIAVLAGGLSTERDVSIITGKMVASALKEKGHKVVLLDVFMGLTEILQIIFLKADTTLQRILTA